MKNFEFWEKEIKEIASDYNSSIALVSGKPVSCKGLHCGKCDWGDKRCSAERVEWLYAERVESPKINSRTKKFFEAIQTGWVARDDGGAIYHYSKKPEKIITEWYLSNADLIEMSQFNFLSLDFIKWKDKEPWAVEDILKLDVCDEGGEKE